jgi:hypothetical protein
MLLAATAQIAALPFVGPETPLNPPNAVFLEIRRRGPAGGPFPMSREMSGAVCCQTWARFPAFRIDGIAGVGVPLSGMSSPVQSSPARSGSRRAFASHCWGDKPAVDVLGEDRCAAGTKEDRHRRVIGRALNTISAGEGRTSAGARVLGHPSPCGNATAIVIHRNYYSRAGALHRLSISPPMRRAAAG